MTPGSWLVVRARRPPFAAVAAISRAAH